MRSFQASSAATTFLNISCYPSIPGTQNFYSNGLQTCETNIGSSATKDQIEFRSFVGVDDAFAVFENACSKSMEWSVPIWCANLDLRKDFDHWVQCVVWRFQGAEGSACIFETYSFTISWSRWIGTRKTISNQTRCETRRRSKPIVIQCWLGTRDEKREASRSTLRTSLWWWWLVNKRAWRGWLDAVCKKWQSSCNYGRVLGWGIGSCSFKFVFFFKDQNFDN